jgi:hypothetical protein
MTDMQTPPDWVLIEAAKRAWGETTDPVSSLRYIYTDVDTTFRALCDMIEKYEQPPPDRKLLCAREALNHFTDTPKSERSGQYLMAELAEDFAVLAIQYWEEGFGK